MTKPSRETKYVPVIGIQEFRKGQLAGRDELLFNELRGARHIDKPHKHDFFIIMLFEKAQGFTLSISEIIRLKTDRYTCYSRARYTDGI